MSNPIEQPFKPLYPGMAFNSPYPHSESQYVINLRIKKQKKNSNYYRVVLE